MFQDCRCIPMLTAALTNRNWIQLTRKLLCIVCALLTANLLTLRAQTSGLSPAGQPNTDSTENNTEAIQILKRTLLALGGETAWADVHGLAVSGEITPAMGGSTRNFQWVDDWSNATLRSSRKMTSASGTLSASTDGTHHQTRLLHGNRVPVQELSNAASLARQAPAESLMLILHKHAYQVEKSNDSSTSNLLCVVVRAGSYASPIIMKWYLLPATGLPDHVQVAIPDQMSRGRLLWQTITYHGYTVNGQLVLPASESVQLGNAPPSLITFQSFGTNPTTSASDFTGAGQ